MNQPKTKLIAIMQPTYLPWLGYFDLIDQADEFVFLDNVQFSKQSWQQRNRIRTPEGLLWLTVPVLLRGVTDRAIHQIRINMREGFPKPHLRSIELNYRRAPYFENYYSALEKIYHGAEEHQLLSQLNIELIGFFCRELGLKPNFHKTSEMNLQKEGTHRLVEICRNCNATDYLSTPGALEYLSEDYPIFKDAEIPVWIHQYEHPEYRQLQKSFLPFASVLDLLFNEGPNSLEVIRSGRKKTVMLGEGGLS